MITVSTKAGLVLSDVAAPAAQRDACACHDHGQHEGRVGPEPGKAFRIEPVDLGKQRFIGRARAGMAFVAVGERGPYDASDVHGLAPHQRRDRVDDPCAEHRQCVAAARIRAAEAQGWRRPFHHWRIKGFAVLPDGQQRHRCRHHLCQRRGDAMVLRRRESHVAACNHRPRRSLVSRQSFVQHSLHGRVEDGSRRAVAVRRAGMQQHLRRQAGAGAAPGDDVEPECVVERGSMAAVVIR
jgi:hypothetical protein